MVEQMDRRPDRYTAETDRQQRNDHSADDTKHLSIKYVKKYQYTGNNFSAKLTINTFPLIINTEKTVRIHFLVNDM